MKIVIDARFYGLENAGLGRYTINLVEQLSKQDKENSYYILLRKKYFNSLRFPQNWVKVLADIPHYTLREQIELPKILKTIQFDFVHFLHFNVPFRFQGKYIVTIHDLLMHNQKGLQATTLPFFVYYFKRFGYKSVFSRAVRRAEHVLVPSQFVKNELRKHYTIDESRVHVTYEGVHQRIILKKARLSVVEKHGINAPYFIYTGNAYPHKNIPRAIEAIVQLNKQSDEKILFVIVSSRNVFTRRLEKMIVDLGAKEYVRLLGFVEDNELATLYRYSLGFVYPSFSEGFGLPALEAMTNGTLALVSDIPVFKEIYGKAALYFNPYDFSSIQKTMLKVFTMDKETRFELLRKGISHARLFTWEKMANQTLAIYSKMQ